MSGTYAAESYENFTYKFNDNLFTIWKTFCNISTRRQGWRLWQNLSVLEEARVLQWAITVASLIVLWLLYVNVINSV